jgi:release factor glutamine methyltransferase
VRLDQWLREAESKLNAAGVESSKLEAQVLAAHSMGKERAWVLAHGEQPIGLEGAGPLLERRLRREPLAYILGHREFFGRKFKVNASVLIPRQETEILIEAALKLLPHDPVRILDLGAGSGCIGITLALERLNWEVWASDVSEPALEVAKENAQALNAKVHLVQSDAFQAFANEEFEAIVTNPPYVEEDADLQPEVRDWEPQEALFSGNRGLDFFTKLALEASQFLKPGAPLIVEIGDGQASATSQIFETLGWQAEEKIKDLSGHERVLVFLNPTPSPPSPSSLLKE